MTGQEAITFVVPGVPVAQGRARAFRVGGGIRMRDPQKSVDWKRTLGNVALVTMREQGRVPFAAGVPLQVYVSAIFQRPKSTPKRLGSGRMWKTGRPDADNIGKAVLDGLNGIAYHDDSNVAIVNVMKFVAGDGEDPRTEVTIRRLDNAETFHV